MGDIFNIVYHDKNMKRSKKYNEVAKLVDPNKAYHLEEAIALVKRQVQLNLNLVLKSMLD